MLGEANTIVGRRETYPGLGAYATSLWRPGDRFCDTYATPVSLAAPGPAVYALEVGLFDLRTGERLPPADAAGQRLGLVTLDYVKVAGPSAVMPASVASAAINFGDEITLLGYQVGPARAGLSLEVDLYWQANGAIGRDYTVFVHLLDMDGRIVAQEDSRPQAGRYPTRWWDARETVLDGHAVPLPADLPEGGYRLLVGWYLPQTGERLPASGGGGDSADLGVIRIER